VLSVKGSAEKRLRARGDGGVPSVVRLRRLPVTVPGARSLATRPAGSNNETSSLRDRPGHRAGLHGGSAHLPSGTRPSRLSSVTGVEKAWAGRRGGAEGRSPSAERSEHDGGPQRQDPEACTVTKRNCESGEVMNRRIAQQG